MSPLQSRAALDRGVATPGLLQPASLIRHTNLSGEIPGEDYPEAKWIFFAASGDSIAVSVDSSALSTNFGQEKVGRITASSFHKRLARDGVLTVDVSMYRREESLPYAIRFQQFASSTNALLRPTGERAFLRIGSVTDTERFAIIPRSKMLPGTDPSPWEVPEGDYRVALLADSLYVVCRNGCSIADTLKLTPGERATAFQ